MPSSCLPKRSCLSQVVLCFLFYNWAGLNLLLYLGWIVLVIAMVLGWRARVAFKTLGQASEKDSWLRTTTVVDNGVYAVTRHPMYLAFMLIFFALACISQHWLSVIIGAAGALMIYNDMRREEKGNVDKFGEDYLRYMHQVPRMNFTLGIMRLVQRRKIEND
jgi:protein-S-isoprenylcysteine O-methyltransferase Ste14